MAAMAGQAPRSQSENSNMLPHMIQLDDEQQQQGIHTGLQGVQEEELGVAGGP